MPKHQHFHVSTLAYPSNWTVNSRERKRVYRRTSRETDEHALAVQAPARHEMPDVHIQEDGKLNCPFCTCTMKPSAKGGETRCPQDFCAKWLWAVPRPKETLKESSRYATAGRWWW